MKITKIASKSIIKLSKTEWETIGKTAGWIRSQDVLDRLEISKQEAVKIAKEIKVKLEAMGYEVPNIDIKDKVIIKTIKDGEGRSHNTDIELKPWANKNNNKYELRGGVIIMAGPYAHKKFRRKRFSPKHVGRMIDFLKKVFKYTVDMDRLRTHRSEKSEKSRADKFECARQNKLPEVL